MPILSIKDRQPISSAKRTERVIKICESCESETTTQWRLAQASLEKWGRVLCATCSRTRDNKPVRMRHGRKLKSGKVGNYIEVWDERRKRYVGEHHLVLEAHTGFGFLEAGWLIHHINGKKDDNVTTNLCALPSNAEHRKLHGQLEQIAFSLVQRGVIIFDHQRGVYEISPSIELSTMPVSLGFEDVALVQQRGKVASRANVTIAAEIIRGVKLEIPLIAANMSTVTNSSFCILLDQLGALGVLHRAASDEQLEQWTKEIAAKSKWTAVSVGVGPTQVDLAKRLIRAGAAIVFIDVAHGYIDPVLDTGRWIRKFASDVRIVVGNTTNPGLFAESCDFADAVKVGIAQGFACETKNMAGVSEKQFSALMKCAQASQTYGLPMISDGGIREPADFVKAIAGGAAGVMAGKIFAMCPESAAPEVDGQKVYAGMASRYVQEKWLGKIKNNAPEGGTHYLPIGESAAKLLTRYAGALRSGISYSGAERVVEFQNKATWVKTVTEGTPHGLG